MVAVQHEVHFADLIDFDRIHAHANRVHGGSFDVRPALLVTGTARQEGACEFGIAPDAPDNGVDGDVLQSLIGTPLQLELVGDLFIGKQLIRLARNARQNSLQLGAQVSRLKIADRNMVVWTSILLKIRP
jgi:hypothetical protein